MQGKSGEALRIAGEVPDRLNGKKGLYLGKIHIIMEKTKEYRSGTEKIRGRNAAWSGISIRKN